MKFLNDGPFVVELVDRHNIMCVSVFNIPPTDLEARDRTHEPWFTMRVVYRLHYSESCIHVCPDLELPFL